MYGLGKGIFSRSVVDLGWSQIRSGNLEAEVYSVLKGKTMTQTVEYIGRTGYRVDNTIIGVLENQAIKQGAKKLIIRGNNIVEKEGWNAIRRLEEAGFKLKGKGEDYFEMIKKLK